MTWDPQVKIDKLFKDFDPSHGITIGTLIHLAEKNGWQPTLTSDSIIASDVRDHADNELLAEQRYTFLDRDALLALPKLRWRVKHVLPTRGVAAIYGPSGSGKSFLALDLATSICLGTDWFGKKCKRTPVVYLGLEGAAGIQNRIKAWEVGRDQQLPTNFSAVFDEFDLTKDADTQAIAQQTVKGSVLIIDTLNRATSGRDENSSSDMGIILASAKRLEQAIEGLVLLVHHTGKDQSKGLRGHSSLHAALDAAIAVKNDKDNTKVWSLTKSKDGADQQDFGFRLKQHVIGTDEDGETETSCTVEPEGLGTKPQPQLKPKGSQQGPAYDALKNLMENSLINGQGGAPFYINCVSLDAAVAEVAGTLSTVDKGKRKNRAKALIDTFTSGGFLMSGIDSETDESWFWLPDT
jgi:hypothetical protein